MDTSNTTNVIKRVMPNSLEAEQSVIGAMIMDADAIGTASESLTGEEFYNRQLGVIYDAIVELNNGSKGVDVVTLQEKLKEKNVPPEFSSMEYINNIVMAVPTSANIREYVDIVREKATLRRLIRTSEETAAAAYAQNEPVDAILENAEKRVFEITERRGAPDDMPIAMAVMETLKRIEKAAQTKGAVTGLPTGFTDLDYNLSGLQPSDLVLIAARPSMGKTALALNIAQYLAIHENVPVAIFSLEMPRDQLIRRLLAMESRVDASKLRSGDLQDPDWEALIESVNVIGSSKLEIVDVAGINITEMRSRCRRLKAEKGIQAIFVDYLQLVTATGNRANESKQQEVSEISRTLKSIARELNVPVVALSQLSRESDKRTDHRPMLSDLRESGAIEQDADVVMFIYRDDYYHKDTEKHGVAEIIIAKQRNGPIGTVELLWRPELTKFANLARQ